MQLFAHTQSSNMNLSIPTADDCLHVLKIQIRPYVNTQTTSVHLGAQIGYNDLYILKSQIQLLVHTQNWNMHLDAQVGYSYLHTFKIKIQCFVHTHDSDMHVGTPTGDHALDIEYNYLSICIIRIRTSARTSGTIICTYSKCKYMSLLFSFQSSSLVSDVLLSSRLSFLG